MKHLKALLEEWRVPLDKTYFDVPNLRSSASDYYLTTVIAYEWHPHRGPWYSAPLSQTNWWIPTCDYGSDNATMHDDLRGIDRYQLPAEIVALYDDRAMVEGEWRYELNEVSPSQ